MKKYQDLEVHARATRDQAIREKQAIIAATAEMKKIRNIIYQVRFEFNLEKAQVPINIELNKTKVTCPNNILYVTVETEDRTEVLASTDGAADGNEGQRQ